MCVLLCVGVQHHSDVDSGVDARVPGVQRQRTGEVSVRAITSWLLLMWFFLMLILSPHLLGGRTPATFLLLPSSSSPRTTGSSLSPSPRSSWPSLCYSTLSIQSVSSNVEIWFVSRENTRLICFCVFDDTGFQNVAFYYLIPYMITNYHLVLITYLQHTDVYMPHFRNKVSAYEQLKLVTLFSIQTFHALVAPTYPCPHPYRPSFLTGVELVARSLVHCG